MRKRKKSVLLTLLLSFMMIVSAVTPVHGEDDVTTETFFCEKIEHEHTEDCYDESGNLICALDEHVHTDECLKQEEIIEDNLTDESEEVPDDNNEISLVVTADEEDKTEVENITDSYHEYTIDDFDDGEGDFFLAVLPVCNTLEHTHTEECYDEHNQLICSLLEHEHNDECYYEKETVPAVRPNSIKLMAAPPIGPFIPEDVQITTAMMVENRSYVEILGERYYLKDMKNTDPVIEEVPDETPVRLCLVVNKPVGVRVNQAMVYDLPEKLQWDKVDIQPIKFNGNDVGTYEVVKNSAGGGQVRLTITDEDFLRTHSKVTVRMLVDGHVDINLFDEDEDKEIEFPGIGVIKINDIPIPDKILILKKKVASNQTSALVPNFIKELDNGNLVVYYSVVMNADGGSIDNIVIQDEVKNIVDEEFKIPLEVVGYVEDSFMFGKSYGTNNRMTADSIQAEGQIKTQGNETVRYTFGINPETNKSFTLRIDGTWEPIYGNLYITYGVEFKKPNGADIKEYTDPANAHSGDIRNTMVGTGNDVPKVVTTDDFTYESVPVEKSGAAVAKSSYTAQWTVTLNDYDALTGFVYEGKNIIKDTLKTPVDASGNIITKTDGTKVLHVLNVDEEGNPIGAKLTAYALNENGVLTSITDVFRDMRIPANNDESELDPSKWSGTVSDLKTFFQYYLQESQGETTGVYAPSNIKYIITYQTKIDDADQQELTGDLAAESINLTVEYEGEPYDVYQTSGGIRYIRYKTQEFDEEAQEMIDVVKYYEVGNNETTGELEVKDTEASGVKDSDKVISYKPVRLKNSAENGDNSTEDSSTGKDGIGVGPSSPETVKEKEELENPELVEWMIVLDITDEKAQVKNNTIYDFLEYGHELDFTSLDFYATSRDKSGKLVMTKEVPDPENPGQTKEEPIEPTISYGNWQYGITSPDESITVVEVKESSTQKDAEMPSKENPDRYNFSFNVGAALYLKGVLDSVNSPLPKGSYVIKFKTKLDASQETGPVVGNGFKYMNHTFAIKQNDDLIEKQKEHIITVISKANLTGSAALFEKIYGEPLSSLAYQEIPWFISCKAITNPLKISDVFEHGNYGDMELEKDSIVVYQTNEDVSLVKTRNELDWSDPEKALLVDKSNYTITDNGTDGFEITFEKDCLSKDKVAIFYITKATDGSIKNNTSVYYRNTTTIPFDNGKTSPSDYDYVSKYYEIVSKKAEFESDKDVNPERIANYTVKINTSGLDLNHDDDTLYLEDNLNEYLDYIAGSMKFTDKDGNDITSECVIDASESHTLKLIVPDETPITMTYQAVVTYNPEAGGEKDLVNEIVLRGFDSFKASAVIQVKVVVHKVVIEGSTFNIRVFKYDEEEPEVALPGAIYDIYAYHVVTDKDGKKHLELFDDGAMEYGSNPVRLETDENGEFVFHGKYDAVYKIVEVQAPEGYVVTDKVEYFVRPGHGEADDFKDIEDENKQIINPKIYHMYEEVDEIRYTMSNHQAGTALILRKTNKKCSPIYNAIFNICKEDGTYIYENYRIDNDAAELLLEDLEPGRYYIEEVQAPKGYVRESRKVYFTYDGEYTYTVDRYDFLEFHRAKDKYEPNLLIYKNTPYVDIPLTGD